MQPRRIEGREQIREMRRSRNASAPSSVPRSVFVGARRTSLRLEPIMWEALADIAAERGREIHDLITEISIQHEEPNLSAATRVYIVKFYRDKLRGRDG